MAKTTYTIGGYSQSPLCLNLQDGRAIEIPLGEKVQVDLDPEDHQTILSWLGPEHVVEATAQSRATPEAPKREPTKAGK